MLRVTTLHASSASATAAYYAQYLTAAPGEVPGVWSGRQAAGLGLSGTVDVDSLESLLSGRDPASGTPLGRELIDRYTTDGKLIRAVSGFDATFSAPKSLSAWWALTGDRRLLDAHDIAAAAALTHLERFGSTTRIRSNGGRLHPDTHGLTMATFRQTTSRADDPQIHTHAVISAKVQTVDGRWLALDARYLKRHQRMLGGLYQSVLRSELTNRFGVEWGPIVNGQTEIAGVPKALLEVFSKRAAAIDVALAVKVDEFRHREGRDPSRWERAAMTREASADTRGRKSGNGAADLATRWQTEASSAGWTSAQVEDAIEQAARDVGSGPVDAVTITDVVAAVSTQRSSWGRPDVVQAICDVQRPVSQMPGHRWLDVIERAADRVLEQCVDLDPADTGASRRMSDGRSLWTEPTAPRFTSEAVLAEEEHILTWALDAHIEPAAPSTTVDRHGLDVMQGAAAASVAGDDRLVLVLGPAGAGKTRMLAAAITDLNSHGRPVFGLAPTAKAARVLERDTVMRADTVAKLLHEWRRTDRPPLADYQPPVGTTMIVDEAGMLSTPALHDLVTLAGQNVWRLVLVGDHRQLQAVGRGGLFAELCTNGRVAHLEQLHRFTHRWEAAASLLLRIGDPRALDAYETHDRIIPGPLNTHVACMADTWIDHHSNGKTIALVASTNEHVDTINHAVQQARLAADHLSCGVSAVIGGGERAYLGDVVATRRNDRHLLTSTGEPVRNRETWTVTALAVDGSLTVTQQRGHGTVTLPADYAREHVRLGYAATEHGHQSDTVDTSISLASPATTRRGLYVGATRGRDENVICVITDTTDVAEAGDILDGVLAVDRAEIPAVTQRRTLAEHLRQQVPAPVVAPAVRFVIPDWFEPLLAQARTDLAAIKQRHAERATTRRRLDEAVAAADRAVRVVGAATASDRRELSAAEKGAQEKRWDYYAAERRLAASPRRSRRRARHDLDVTSRELELANDMLAQTQQRTAPSIERYQQASSVLQNASDNVHHHDVAAQLDALYGDIGPAERRLDALETWQRWAHGDTITVEQLSDAMQDLSTGFNRDNREHLILGQAFQTWADATGAELQVNDLRARGPEHPGLELDL